MRRATAAAHLCAQSALPPKSRQWQPRTPRTRRRRCTSSAAPKLPALPRGTQRLEARRRITRCRLSVHVTRSACQVGPLRGAHQSLRIVFRNGRRNLHLTPHGCPSSCRAYIRYRNDFVNKYRLRGAEAERGARRRVQGRRGAFLVVGCVGCSASPCVWSTPQAKGLRAALFHYSSGAGGC